MNNTLTSGLYGLDTLKNYGIENSADANVLSRMIDSLLSYPADSYGLIFFSHASGWLPSGALSNPRSSETNQQDAERINPNEVNLRSIGRDGTGSTRKEMEVDDFARAIPNNKLDFIILEACLMADVMSMYELRDKAEYVVASSAEIVSPGFTFIYRDHIMQLYDTKRPIFSVVSGFAQAYHDYITERFNETDAYCSLTLGIIKMNEMRNLATTVKAALGGVEIHELNLLIDSIQSFDRPLKPSLGGKPYSRYFDFSQTIENLVSASHYAAFQTQMDKTVVWKANTKRFLVDDHGFLIKRHCGLTTYILQDVYPFLNEFNKNSSWSKAIY
jgi:hypothetical protein